MMSADTRAMRAYVVLVTRGTGAYRHTVAKVNGLFASISDASAHGAELGDHNARVIAWPLVERTTDEGRLACKAGRQLHLGATQEARDGYEQAARAAAREAAEKARYERIIRRDHDAERLNARSVFGNSTIFS